VNNQDAAADALNNAGSLYNKLANPINDFAHIKNHTAIDNDIIVDEKSLIHLIQFDIAFHIVTVKNSVNHS